MESRRLQESRPKGRRGRKNDKVSDEVERRAGKGKTGQNKGEELTRRPIVHFVDRRRSRKVCWKSDLEVGEENEDGFSREARLDEVLWRDSPGQKLEQQHPRLAVVFLGGCRG